MWENPLTKKEQIMLAIATAMISTMHGWDLLGRGDFSPEEDTPMKTIADKAEALTNLVMERCK